MCYKWQLLDLDNRVTVTMGNLSEIGGETFRFCTTLRMYDRSIHLWCLTYDRPPKHKKSASNYNSWTVQWHCCGHIGTRGAWIKTKAQSISKGGRPVPGCALTGVGFFGRRLLNWYLQDRPGARRPPGTWREKLISGAGTRFYRGMPSSRSFPFLTWRSDKIEWRD